MASQNDQALAAIRVILENACVVKHCISCQDWDGKQDICTRYQVVPPPKIIAYGCEQWVPDIPF